VILRDYQEEAVDSIFEYWENELGKNPLVCAPTGSGKSLIIADFCQRVCKDWSGVRIACVTDSRELIAQNEKELRQHYVTASTGIYGAGLGKRQTQAQITFVGIQSIYNKGFDLGKQDIIIIDESHMIGRDNNTRYGKFIKDMLIANPNLVVVGLTATPYRLDSGMLHEGDGALFDGICYVVEVKKLIREGYLVPVISKGGVRKIDLKDVHIRAGEYASNELAHAADDPELIRLAVDEIVRYGQDRKAWLIFASGVEHAEHVKNEFIKHDVVSALVTGETPKEERDKIIGSFREGKLRCLVNVGVLTKGFNAPICDLIALLMATKSTGKYVQIVGRGMRTHNGKENCLLLDYGGNCLAHGPIDEIDPVKKKNVFNVEKKAPPMKECPQCRLVVHARVTVCACGYQFPVVAPHGTEAYDGAVMSSQVKPEVIPIAGVWIGRHKKPGRPDSVKITFYTALDMEYYMWVGLDHDGYYKEKSLAVVKRFGGKAKTVDEALKESQYWRKPVAIAVKPRGRFFDIVGIIFDDTKTQERPQDIQRDIAKDQKVLTF
jgi:DNA repair protein RadD